MRRAPPLLAIFFFAAFPLLAAEPQGADAGRRLKELESALEQGKAAQEQIERKAAALNAELDVTRSDLVRAARAVQENEEALSELETQLSDLTALETDKSAALELKRQQTGKVLTALQRLAFRPTEALIAQPAPPVDTLRSAILLKDVLPKIEEEAGSLKRDLASLSEIKAEIARQKKKIAGHRAALDEEHQRIAGLYQRKSAMSQAAQAESEETARRLAAMGAEAADLRDLLNRIEEEKRRQAQEAAARAAAEKAAREAQIAAARAAREAQIAADKAARDAEQAAARAAKQRQDAEVAAARQARAAEEQAAREARDAAEKSEQATKEATEAAARTAGDKRQALQRANRPFGHAQGTIPFPARGQIVVRFGQNTEPGEQSKGITIETRSGAQVIAPYDGDVVFAGPFRDYGLLLIIEHGEGYHTLLAGMGRIDTTVGQRLLAGEPVGTMAQSDGKPLLYVELRHNGQPVNPLSWLTARKTKVSG